MPHAYFSVVLIFVATFIGTNFSNYIATYILCIIIKTHDSESRGQEEAGRTRRTSELFTVDCVCV